MSQALASASVPKWDNIETVKTALEHGFSTVQLFIDQSTLLSSYKEQLIELLNTTNLAVILHLPDFDKTNLAFNDEYLKVAEEVISQLNNKVTVLIHHHKDMSEDNVPMILGKYVGLENSQTGFYTPESITIPFELCKKIKAPFVFDWERILYDKSADGRVVAELEITTFIKSIIISLDPSTDIIHLRDKLSLSQPYWKAMCAFPTGINKAFIQEIKDFEQAGGLIVWEYWDLNLTLESSKALTQL